MAPARMVIPTGPIECLPRPIQSIVTRAICGVRACRHIARPVCLVLLSLLLQGCARPPVHDPVTLSFLEEWSNKTFGEARQQELQQFTRETGIRVNLLPSPDSARQRLVLWRELLETGASGPDVYAIDCDLAWDAWPNISWI